MRALDTRCSALGRDLGPRAQIAALAPSRSRTAALALLFAIVGGARSASAQRAPEWTRHLRALATQSALRSSGAVTERAPANPVAQRTHALLQRTVSIARSTRYNHRTVVDARAGRYEFDCSGLVAWVLAQTAPDALAAIHSARPVAAEIARTIAHAPEDRARQGWQRVARVTDVRPGDVFAWRNPRWLRGATGHTGFVAGPIEPIEGDPTLFRVRITDANAMGYENDTRAVGTGGLGTGAMLFSVDPRTGAINGIVAGYQGVNWVLPLEIVVGRVSS